MRSYGRADRTDIRMLRTIRTVRTMRKHQNAMALTSRNVADHSLDTLKAWDGRCRPSQAPPHP